MSFELWCQITLYDPAQLNPPGGVAFHRLMHLLLTSSKSSGLGQDPSEMGLFWDADKRMYGDSFTTSQPSTSQTVPWQEYVSGEGTFGEPKRDLSNGFTAQQLRDNETTLQQLKVFDYDMENHFCFSGAHGSFRMRQSKTNSGIVDGNNQENKYKLNKAGFANKTRQDRAKQYADTVVSLSNVVYSRHDWLMKCNIRFGIPHTDAAAVGNPGQSIANALFTKGVDSDKSLCWESRKPPKDRATAAELQAALDGEGDTGRCQAVGNTIAMIYGLYYYPDCKNQLYQWTRYEKVGETYYAIRFRCPNPHYGLPKWYTRQDAPALDDDGRLRVYETLNPLNQAFVRLKHLSKDSPYAEMQKYVGGTYMRVPQVGKLMPIVQDKDKMNGQHLFSMWTALANQDKLTLAVPFIGMFNDYEHYHVYESSYAPNYRKAGEMMYKAGIKSIHQPTGVADDARTRPYQLGFRVPAALLLYPHYPDSKVIDEVPDGETAIYSTYMTDPKLNSNQQTFNKDWQWTNNTPFAYQMFNWEEWKDLDKIQWRQKLLGNAPATVPQTTAPVDAADAQAVQMISPQAPVDVGLGPQDDQADGERDEEAELDTTTGEDMGNQEDNNLIQDSNNLAGEAQEEQQRTYVESDLGIPGATLGDMLRDCDPQLAAKIEKESKTGLDAQIRRALRMKFERLSEDMKKAFEMCNLTDKALNDGATRRDDKDVNCHWSNSRYAPYSHMECYEEPRASFKFERVGDTKEGDADLTPLEQYQRDYGHQANLYTNGDVVTKLTDVEHSWGFKKDLMDSRLDAYGDDDLHVENMAKILAIYFSPDGIGRDNRSHVHFTRAQKRNGMLNGLYVAHASEQGEHQYPQPGPMTGNKVLLWPPVFKKKPETVLKGNTALIRCLTGMLCTKIGPEEDVSHMWACLDAIPNWREKIRKIESEMTVAQWVTTPWHYETLPYQHQYAIFKDGEGFSEGCRRCSRSFYEYGYLVYGDAQAAKGAQHWPQSFYKRNNNRTRAVRDAEPEPPSNLAPLPFHDATFWSNDGVWPAPDGPKPRPLGKRGQRLPDARFTGTDATARAVEIDQGLDDFREFGNELRVGRTMTWPSFTVKLLESGSGPPELKGTGNANAMFRRYYSPAYAGVDADGDDPNDYASNKLKLYTGIPQGRMCGWKHKIKFGAVDYRVMRSHKFGNVCRDCAFVLESAPGLFVHNNRVVLDAGLVIGDMNKQVKEGTQNYWTQLAVEVDEKMGTHVPLDALFTRKDKREAQWAKLTEEQRKRLNEQLESARVAVARTLSDKHKYPSRFTKYNNPPNINVQQAVYAPKVAQQDENIKLAVRQIDELISNKTIDPSAFDNSVFIDILNDVKRRLVMNNETIRVDQAAQYDTDKTRIEYRNCILRWEPGPKFYFLDPSKGLKYDGLEADQLGIEVVRPDKGVYGTFTKNRYATPDIAETRVWYNCLVTETYDPQKLSAGPNGQTRPASPEDYRFEVFLATSRGPQHSALHPRNVPTEWHGDGFVTSFQNGQWARIPEEFRHPKSIVKQRRAWRQSRLFITYSLHRPVTDEREGKLIMQRMADAAYELFGNDKWLSQMLRFGKTLRKALEGPADNISRVAWEPIYKTNKKEAMDNFYGNDSSGHTSYIYDTYETHVEKVDLDGGIEIGPKMHHPHFHMLLTLDHYGYVQFDYYKMNTLLEIMFRGLDTYHGWGDRFFLKDINGNPFYGDNEFPYVDIRLYPQDNWKEIIAAYVRKPSVGGGILGTVGRRAIDPRETREDTRAEQTLLTPAT